MTDHQGVRAGGRRPNASALSIAEMTSALERWAVAHYRTPVAEISNVRPMPGNAGLSFGFTLKAGAQPVQHLVIRLAPPGVKKQGSADVLRQVPLLRALAESGRPVAPVRWEIADPQWFGTDGFVVDLLPGRPLHMTNASLSAPVGTSAVAACLDQAVDALADLHQTPWRPRLAQWMSPRSIGEEIDFWWRLMTRVASDSRQRTALVLRERLLREAPSEPQLGITHGDFQTNNVLFTDDGRLLAIIDWELAGIGAQLLDLGWLAMMTDRSMWTEPYVTQLRVCASPADLLERYESRCGRKIHRLGWYTALAALRFASIIVYNHRLHRTGKRPDALYELLEPSVDHLIHRGLELVSH